MNMQHLQPLVEQAMQGDKRAYAKLCEEIIHEVLYICVRITGNLHLGEDAAQDTLVQMGGSIKKLRKPEAFPAWLNRCITNACRQHLRRERRFSRDLYSPPPEQETEFLPAEWAEKQERRAIVLDALKQLAPRQQHLLLMFYFENMSIQEIASTTGQNPGTVKSNLHYARQSLKARIEKRSGQPVAGPGAALAGVPTLTSIFQRDAALLVTEESSKRVLAAVGLALAGAGAAVATGQGVALLLASLAPAAVGIALAAAATIVGSPSPPLTPFTGTSAASPSAAIGEPQNPSSGGEGELNIPFQPVSAPTSASSGAALEPSAQASVPSAGQATALPFVATGACVLADTNGAPLPIAEVDLSGIRVQAFVADTLVAETVTATDGSYSLQLPDASLAYTVRLVFGGPRSFSSHEAQQTLRPGEETLAAFALRDTAPPACRVLFYDANGGSTGTGNPHRAEILVEDATPCTVSWQMHTADGTHIDSGTGISLPLAATLPPAFQPYILYIEVVDSFENSTSLEYSIYIY